MRGPPGGPGGSEPVDARAIRDALALAATKRGRAASRWVRIDAQGIVASTQDVVSRMEAEGAPDGTVVVASAQSDGRGRHGRRWHSPEGSGLYLSALVRIPERERSTRDASGLTAMSLGASVAVCRALLDLVGAPFEIKWPNDILVEGRKIAGVLAESRISGNAIRAVIFGCGVNLGHREEDFPVDLRGIATSLKIITAKTGQEPPTPDSLCAAILDGLDETVGRILAGDAAGVLSEWRRLSPSSTGKRVRVINGGSSWNGVTAGVGEDGALRVVDDTGTQRALRFGEEISFREVT